MRWEKGKRGASEKEGVKVHEAGEREFSVTASLRHRDRGENFKRGGSSVRRDLLRGEPP